MLTGLLTKLVERLLISYLLYQVERLEKKLEKKKLDLNRKLPQHRHQQETDKNSL